ATADSPPHRWLRNTLSEGFIQDNHSPPHRWLRKNASI
ncbi:hypothetical protein, partial [uncultured Gammaproteobacteria bacterium]